METPSLAAVKSCFQQLGRQATWTLKLQDQCGWCVCAHTCDCSLAHCLNGALSCHHMRVCSSTARLGVQSPRAMSPTAMRWVQKICLLGKKKSYFFACVHFLSLKEVRLGHVCKL